MPPFTNQQGYSNNNGPAQYRIPTSQPMIGNLAVTGTAGTFFQYDILTPYGTKQSVSNEAQTTRVMVGWGLTVLIGLLVSTDMTLTILVNGGATATFTQIDTSPIAVTANAKWQFITVGPLAAAQIRGQLATASNSTAEYHIRLIE